MASRVGCRITSGATPDDRGGDLLGGVDRDLGKTLPNYINLYISGNGGRRVASAGNIYEALILRSTPGWLVGWLVARYFSQGWPGKVKLRS